MDINKPNVSKLPEEVVKYIDFLENEIKSLKLVLEVKNKRDYSPEPIPSEPPTTLNLIILSNSGFVKRTPRHLYTRQRRGGMGVFDIDITEADYPATMAEADIDAILVCLSDQGRLFHLPVKNIIESEVRARGEMITNYLPILPDERITTMNILKSAGYLAILSQKGYVRMVRNNFLGTHIRPGSPIMDTKRFGSIVNAEWINSNDEVFIGTRSGLGIRFSSKRIHPNGSLGIRLDRNDKPIAITRANDSDSIFLLGQDGKGTIRQMSGFRSNKSPGSSGKIALKTNHLIAGSLVNKKDDIFIITKLCKIIRFQASEIPPKTGTVQGVNCMALRSDNCVASIVVKMNA